MCRPGVGEDALDVVVDAGARVEARGKRLGEADAEVDRRELADPAQRADQLQRAQGQRRRLLDEAEVVGLQDLVEVEVFELGGDPRVQHLHHLVGGDAVGEHPGDEGAGAGADVDVEVVDRAVDGEQVEGAQGADLIDAAGEAPATQHQSRLRRAFAGTPPSRLSVDVHNFAHKHGLSQEMRRSSCLLVTLLLLLAAVSAAPASAARRWRQPLPGPARPPGARRRTGQRPVRRRRRDREARLRPGARRQRPLASNMKLFTTSTVLSRFGPEARIETRVLADGPIDKHGVLHGNLYLKGGGDPTLGSPAFYDAFHGGLGDQPLRAEAPVAGTRRPDPGDRPPLRRRHDLRPPARGRRLRLRDQRRNRPALGARLQLRLRRLRRPRLRPGPGQARRPQAGRGAARGRRRDPAGSRARRSRRRTNAARTRSPRSNRRR